MLHQLRQHLRHRRRYAHGWVTVSDEPHFDEAGRIAFERALAECSSYLEFGSGGSSIVAARTGKPFISVESDPDYAELVRQRADAVAPGHRGMFLHADIGLVASWGYPAFTRPTRSRLGRWRRYSESPWSMLAQTPPDLILVDGRFRVSCALAVVQPLEGRDWRLLVDDYTGRPQYHVIEQFATLSATHGRMAEFRPRPVDRTQLELARQRHQADYE